MRRTQWWIHSLVLAGTCLIALAPTAFADDAELQRALTDASKLRDHASKDFYERRYADAADKLRRAAAIYDTLGAQRPAGDLAVTLRALLWNEVNAEQLDKVLPTFQRLFELAAPNAKLHGEFNSAGDALWAAGKKLKSLAAVEELMGPVEKLYTAADMPSRASQIRHNRGSLARRLGAYPEAIDHYETAIAQRKANGNEIGECWTRNNVANLYLEYLDKIEPALPHLAAAFALTQKSYVAPPQAAIGYNIRKALEMLEEDKAARTSKWAREWVVHMAETAAASRAGDVVSPGLLYRRGLAWTVETGKPADLRAFAKRLQAFTSAALHPCVAVDVRLRTAGALVEAGEWKDAEKLPGPALGDEAAGPAGQHLQARLALLDARMAAARKERAKLLRFGSTALTKIVALGDKQLIRDAHTQLVETALALVPWPEDEAKQSKHPFASWVAARDEWVSKPVDGGPGGTASAGGDRSRHKELKLDDDLFLISIRDGKVVVRDLVTKSEQSFEVQWTPKPVGINGLNLKLFGGYVVVTSLSYGGGSAVSGMSSETTLEALGDYLPIPAKGYVVVQKNGGIRYR